MSVIRPFKGYRPPVDIVEKLASRPYDVLNTEEAREECAGNPYSLLHVTKAEIDLPAGHKDSDLETYIKVVENFNMFKDYGWLVQDNEEKLYIYAQSMNPKDANAHWQMSWSGLERIRRRVRQNLRRASMLMMNCCHSQPVKKSRPHTSIFR